MADFRSAVARRHGLGRTHGRLLQSLNVNQKVSMNISLAGSNVFQSGHNVFEYAITTSGAVGLNNYTAQWSANDSTLTKATSAAVDSQLAQHYSNLLMQAFANSKRNALDAYDVFHNATNISFPPGATFPEYAAWTRVTDDCKNNRWPHCARCHAADIFPPAWRLGSSRQCHRQSGGDVALCEQRSRRVL